MAVLKSAVMRLSLLFTLLKMLAGQVHLKLTKFTRRAREPKDFFYKVLRGCEFFNDVLRYDLEVIRRSRACLRNLAEQGVHEVALYGERPIVEVLCQVAVASPVKVKRVYEEWNHGRHASLYDAAPLEESIKSREPVIVASLVDSERKKARLLNIGIQEERIVVLV